MANFIRDLLTTLSPEPARAGTAEQEALTRLDERLTSFADSSVQGAAPLLVRAADCAVWDGNPRDQPGLNADSCRSLIESIAAEGGNHIPALIRINRPEAALPYQLLVGSRRRFAIDWLNHNGRPELRLSALVVDMSDEEAFRLADIENRERADICELDRARSYQAAVDRFYGGVQSRMAEALSLSNSQLSRLLALAQLPVEVVDAFATRAELKVRYSELLTPLLRRKEQRANMIAEAMRIGAEQQALAARDERMIPPATVLARLRQVAAPHGPADGGETPIMLDGERIGKVKPGKDGGLAVDLLIGEEVDLDALLSCLRAVVSTARPGAAHG